MSPPPESHAVRWEKHVTFDPEDKTCIPFLDTNQPYSLPFLP